MVPDIGKKQGTNAYGLLAYLYGPGKRDEHVDPHIVASWDNYAPDPGRDPHANLKQLESALMLRVNQLGSRKPKRFVWHCPVRADPGDRHLSDEEWAEVARRIVHATGIAKDGDPDGCRWIAVRHADDHIHIMATTVRGNLTRARINGDAYRAQAECRKIEKEWGLRQLKEGDGTAAKRPTSAELYKAERLGRAEPVRLELRDKVRQAVAGVKDEEEFFERLKAGGLLVKRRIAPSGDLLGYSVADPLDRNAAGEPVYFPGSKLAPDLSLPRIRKRLAGGAADTTALDDDGAADGIRRLPGSRAALARRHAAAAIDEAGRVLESGNDEEGAAQLVGVSEVLDALVVKAPADTRAQLRAAARAFERAARSHVRAERADNRVVRSAARELLFSGFATSRGEDGGVTAMLLCTLVLFAIAAARWNSARGHAQQAEAARVAAAQLREAYATVAARPMAQMAARGRSLPEAVRERHAVLVREHVHRGEQAVEDEGWDALAATLAEAEAAGYDPGELLQRAREQRELGSADSVTAVMVWRVRRLAKLSAAPPAPALSRPATGPVPPPATASAHVSEAARRPRR
ncbi:mobilization protein [Kitasatospora sp. NPDC004669]|uniref:relaxase/mobilization nuclease domain-containing protein n=1 Tax=Kitasatospora sp. NPDC004669 TaxID=3154555 RepID=UPI0033B6E734